MLLERYRRVQWHVYNHYVSKLSTAIMVLNACADAFTYFISGSSDIRKSNIKFKKERLQNRCFLVKVANFKNNFFIEHLLWLLLIFTTNRMNVKKLRIELALSPPVQHKLNLLTFMRRRRTLLNVICLFNLRTLFRWMHI